MQIGGFSVLVKDKDESPESLRAGIPVVSFSIGDAADFAYGASRDEDTCRLVRLESGDVVAILSNGGFDGIYEKLPARLRERT